MLRKKDIFHFICPDNMNLTMIYFMIYCLMFPSANTFTFHTYLKDKSIYQQKLYNKYSILVKDVESCVIQKPQNQATVRYAHIALRLERLWRQEILKTLGGVSSSCCFIFIFIVSFFYADLSQFTDVKFGSNSRNVSFINIQCV